MGEPALWWENYTRKVEQYLAACPLTCLSIGKLQKDHMDNAKPVITNGDEDEQAALVIIPLANWIEVTSESWDVIISNTIL